MENNPVNRSKEAENFTNKPANQLLSHKNVQSKDNVSAPRNYTHYAKPLSSFLYQNNEPEKINSEKRSGRGHSEYRINGVSRLPKENLNSIEIQYTCIVYLMFD